MSFETALQETLYSVLTETATDSLSLNFVAQEYQISSAQYANAINEFLQVGVVGIYDNVPQPDDAGSDSLFPYVTIGEAVHTDWSTDTSSGDDCTITIHSWSRYRGRKEIKEIQGAIYDILHRAELTVTGFAFVSIDWLQSESFTDTDGVTRHGVQTFRILIDQL